MNLLFGCTLSKVVGQKHENEKPLSQEHAELLNNGGSLRSRVGSSLGPWVLGGVLIARFLLNVVEQMQTYLIPRKYEPKFVSQIHLD